MYKGLAFFLIAAFGCCQSAELQPAASFELGRIDSFSATPAGLLSVHIGPSKTTFTQTGPDGVSVLSRHEVSVPFGEVTAAFPRSDGSVLIAATVPDPRRITEKTSDTSFLEFDLYDRNGNKTETHRMVTRSDLPRRPIAAADTSVFSFVGPSSVIERDDLRKGRITGSLDLSAIPGTASFVATNDGTLVGIDHRQNRLIVLPAGSKAVTTVPMPVRAGAMASNEGALYLLSHTLAQPQIATVTKADLSGHVLTSWTCRLESGFVPSRIGVAADSIYLVDRQGNGERFISK